MSTRSWAGTAVAGFCASLLLLSVCSPTRRTSEGLPLGTLLVSGRSGETSITVEIAETEEARRRGLMDRSSLGRDEGMVFLFGGPTRGGFWMKNTRIPLSIAFWGQGGRIVAIMDMTPCLQDPCPSYDPQRTYTGAVEVNRGFFAEHGIGPGDRVALRRSEE